MLICIHGYHAHNDIWSPQSLLLTHFHFRTRVVHMAIHLVGHLPHSLSQYDLQYTINCFVPRVVPHHHAHKSEKAATNFIHQC